MRVITDQLRKNQYRQHCKSIRKNMYRAEHKPCIPIRARLDWKHEGQSKPDWLLCSLMPPAGRYRCAGRFQPQA